ncbi:MAG: hypothetical protein ACRDJ2_13765 [Actinomycetota bacterium]
MSDTRAVRECVTHHHACDCREAWFREIEAMNDSLEDRATRGENQLAALRETQREVAEELRFLLANPGPVGRPNPNRLAALADRLSGGEPSP